MSVRLSHILLTALAVIALSTVPAALAQTTWYVDDDAAPGGGGTGWSDAFDTIEAAIDAASEGDQIWVMAGTYHPPVASSVNRWVFYKVEKSLAIYGGFDGTEETEVDRDARDWQSNETIIDANRSHYYGEVSSPFGTHGFRLGNSPGTTDIRIDGFSITNGYAYHHVNHVYARGGGILVVNGSVTIANCHIHHNNALPTPSSWGGMGGGIEVLMGGSAGSTSALVTNCVIAYNNATYGGGGIDAWSNYTQVVDTLQVVNCKVYRNQCSNNEVAVGGGIRSHLLHSGTLITNSEVWGNLGGVGGGGISMDGGTVSNCTIAFNWTNNADPVEYPAGGLRNINHGAAVYNSILWANESGLDGAHQISAHATVTVNDSDVQGGWATGDNIMDLDPVFVHTNKWNADVHVQPISPCIDAGNSDYIPIDLGDLDHDGDTTEQIPFDLDGRARMIDGDEDGTATVDMGAYEYLYDPNALTHILTVEIAGADGRVTGPGIDCPGACVGEYYDGSELRMYAESSPLALFDHWEGADWLPEWNEAVVWLDEDRTVTAVFTVPPDEPRVEVTPTEVDFDEVRVGGVSTQWIEIKNIGAQPLEIGTIDPPPAPFGFGEEPCSGLVLGTGETCEISARFEPMDELDYSETFTIPSNDPGGDVAVTLTGTGYRDQDDDGVSNREEKGPNGDDPEYDGNGDECPDWFQNNVVSLHSADGEKYLTIYLPETEAYFNHVETEDPDEWKEGDGGDELPDGVYFLYGLFRLNMELEYGVTATTATMLLPAAAHPYTYYQNGPLPSDPNSWNWYEFDYDGQTGATISQNIVSIHYLDAARGDDSFEGANGGIDAMGGPTWTTPDGADDDDGDGVPTAVDNCPFTWNPTQLDSDGDGFGNACDDCVSDPNKRVPGICGCGVSDVDSDGDGVADCEDGCPDDPDKTDPGICGCGVSDTDSDGDGFFDCDDLCPDDPDKAEPGYCGCGNPETDTDDDGVPDCVDNCLNTPNPDQADSNGDGLGDACDGDNDGVDDDTEDGAPNDGDGNNDGIPDSDQDNVTSLVSSNGDYVTIVAPEGTELVGVAATDNPSPDDTPPGAEFPAGFLAFEVHGLEIGGAIELQIIVDLPEGVVFNSYWKYGPTPDDPTPHWYEFMFDGTTGAEIDDNVITLHFVDGLRGDGDLTADGIITDPGAPAFDINAGDPAQEMPPEEILCGGCPCGVGAVGYVPLSLLGLVGLKIGRRRRG